MMLRIFHDEREETPRRALFYYARPPGQIDRGGRRLPPTVDYTVYRRAVKAPPSTACARSVARCRGSHEGCRRSRAPANLRIRMRSREPSRRPAEQRARRGQPARAAALTTARLFASGCRLRDDVDDGCRGLGARRRPRDAIATFRGGANKRRHAVSLRVRVAIAAITAGRVFAFCRLFRLPIAFPRYHAAGHFTPSLGRGR